LAQPAQAFAVLFEQHDGAGELRLLLSGKRFGGEEQVVDNGGLQCSGDVAPVAQCTMQRGCLRFVQKARLHAEQVFDVCDTRGVQRVSCWDLVCHYIF
jgi:hypothetical protein